VEWSHRLRQAISACAALYAEQHGLPHYESLGTPPTVLFEPSADGQHGNLLPASYGAILEEEHWKARLDKPHPRRDALPPRHGHRPRELDSSTSSDALLMNVFCHPRLRGRSRLAPLFGRDTLPPPEFGVPGYVPLKGGGTDGTEIDMRLGDYFVEAKLTEADFTGKATGHVERYADFAEVFEGTALPQQKGKYLNYQLLRNVLAAHAHARDFALICDARRPDLLRAWWGVLQAIKPPALRFRCHFLLWQEIAAIGPKDLRDFLQQKYGIG
jgi:hypothetical protein